MRMHTEYHRFFILDNTTKTKNIIKKIKIKIKIKFNECCLRRALDCLLAAYHSLHRSLILDNKTKTKKNKNKN